MDTNNPPNRVEQNIKRMLPFEILFRMCSSSMLGQIAFGIGKRGKPPLNMAPGIFAASPKGELCVRSGVSMGGPSNHQGRLGDGEIRGEVQGWGTFASGACVGNLGMECYTYSFLIVFFSLFQTTTSTGWCGSNHFVAVV